MAGDGVEEGNEMRLGCEVVDAAAHVQEELNECTPCLPEENPVFATADTPGTFDDGMKDSGTSLPQGGVRIPGDNTLRSGGTDASADMGLCDPDSPGDINADDTTLPHNGHQSAGEDGIRAGAKPVGTEAHRHKESSRSMDTQVCRYSAEPAEIMDLEEEPETPAINLSSETANQRLDDFPTDVSPAAIGQVATLECDAALANLTLSDSDLSSSDQWAPAATFERAALATPQCPDSLAQDFDNIYESDPETRGEEELAEDIPSGPDSRDATGLIDRDQQPAPCAGYRETQQPYVANHGEQCGRTDTSGERFPKPILEPTSYAALMADYWQGGDAVLPGEEVMVKPLYNEDLDTVKESPVLRSLANSAVQTDCVTVDAEVSTDQDVERYMNEVTAEREVLKDRYQEVLDRQTQMENQLQVKVRRLHQRQEEEANIYQGNVKQIQEMKVKLEELKKKSEKEKKEFAQKEQELKNEVERLYANGKRLMREQEEKGNMVAILISDQSDKKEKLNEDMAKLRHQHNELNKNILEETERALKAEVETLECRREFAVRILDQAASETELQICKLSSLPGGSNLAREWRRRLDDIQVQMENIKNQYKGHIQMVKNGTKLSSLLPIELPILPPAPAEVKPDLVLQRTWQARALLPPFFPSSMSTSAPFPPVAFYPRNLPTAPGFPPGLGAQPEVGGRSTPPPSKSAAGKLEKLLEKLEAKFPNCSRFQLTHILQQIKTSRGTIAGLSVDELMQQVAERLSEPEQLRVSTTIPGHFPPAASQTNPYLSLPKGRSAAQSSYQERPALVSGSPRLCLMCQKVVHVSEVHPMACSHIVHKECIKFWAQTNKNSSCPFCPAPR